ncbi:hypothetical protein B296_00054833 [Ensete ventricosum]|uniref:Uncharacterized protein n=1 Tax=Ensete ventricosum TaxID=4639 RepID=A0A426Y2U6_ENSVE|nr:hypothetical protein B296_00054833 [Ensete ventricosum]
MGKIVAGLTVGDGEERKMGATVAATRCDYKMMKRTQSNDNSREGGSSDISEDYGRGDGEEQHDRGGTTRSSGRQIGVEEEGRNRGGR